MDSPNSIEEFAMYLRNLKRERLAGKDNKKNESIKRRPITNADRQIIIEKTDGRCHICGGKVGDQWQADHVLAHSAGGEHSAANYLPAHPTCNNYRWDYLPEEFELILKLGILTRTQIQNETKIGKDCAFAFLKHERNRENRKVRNS